MQQEGKNQLRKFPQGALKVSSHTQIATHKPTHTRVCSHTQLQGSVAVVIH